VAALPAQRLMTLSCSQLVYMHHNWQGKWSVVVVWPGGQWWWSSLVVRGGGLAWWSDNWV